MKIVIREMYTKQGPVPPSDRVVWELQCPASPGSEGIVGVYNVQCHQGQGSVGVTMSSATRAEGSVGGYKVQCYFLHGIYQSSH